MKYKLEQDSEILIKQKAIFHKTIYDIFLSEVIPNIESLSESRFINKGYFNLKEEQKINNQKKPYYCSHFFHELCFVIIGKCIITIGKDNYLLTAGDVCLIKPRVKHYESYTEERTPYHLVWCLIYSKKIRLWISEFSKKGYIRYYKKPRVEVKMNIKPLINEINSEIKNKNPQYFSIIRILLLKFAIYVLRNIRIQNQDNKSNFINLREKIISKAIEYIRKNLTGKITLGDISEVVGLSPNYFCTLFSRSVGFSFKDYLNRIRVEKAKELLLNSNFNIKEITSLTGFKTQTYFNRVFTIFTGLSPFEYKNKR